MFNIRHISNICRQPIPESGGCNTKSPFRLDDLSFRDYFLMDTSSDRYSGTISLIDLYVINKSFKWIRCLTGSQCSFWRIGVIWSYFQVLEDFESSIAEYQQYNVLNYSRKRRNLTHCQHPVIYTGVSSAYKWYLTPHRCAMIPRVRVYIVGTRGPITEPCGTPDNKNWMSDKIPWTDTLWERCSR